MFVMLCWEIDSDYVLKIHQSVKQSMKCLFEGHVCWEEHSNHLHRNRNDFSFKKSESFSGNHKQNI